MNIFDRFHRAFDSMLGSVFIGFVGILLVLGTVYWIMRRRQHRWDRLAYLHQNFYLKAESLVDSFHFVGVHKADFFGRQSPVVFPDRAYALCTIPPPNLMDDGVRDRFRRFNRIITARSLPLFAPCVWKHDHEQLIFVQGGLLRHDGCSLSHLQHYLLDKRLGKGYTEEILLNVAQGLAELHRLTTDSGEPLYHGFLLPRSLFVDFDANRSIEKIVISDLGLPFALAPRKMYQQISLLRSGKAPMEKFTADDLLGQIGMLAPEQKDVDRLEEVGQGADLYAFGALAVVMFTHEKFQGHKNVDWPKVPPKWRSFLQRCLKDNVKARPKDFLELEDWLMEPELALTINHRDVGPGETDKEDVREGNLDALVGAFQRNREKKKSLKTSVRGKSGREFKRLFGEGEKALKASHWEDAREHFMKALEIDPNHAEACAHLAIACYELGEHERAEQYYDRSGKIDPDVAKCFREHIAFRV